MQPKNNHELQLTAVPIDKRREQIVDRLEHAEILSSPLAFLQRVAEMVQRNGGRDITSNEIFSHDPQVLDGFDLAFMDPTLFKTLCAEFGLDAETAEAIMMQTDQPTQPHVHLEGESIFLPLGEQHGYPASAGGTYLGEYSPDSTQFPLDYIEATPGQPFEIPAGTIHFFVPKAGARLTAIAFVKPKIKRDDGFDILNFQLPQVSLNGQSATVLLAS